MPPQTPKRMRSSRERSRRRLGGGSGGGGAGVVCSSIVVSCEGCLCLHEDRTPAAFSQLGILPRGPTLGDSEATAAGDSGATAALGRTQHSAEMYPRVAPRRRAPQEESALRKCHAVPVLALALALTAA